MMAREHMVGTDADMWFVNLIEALERPLKDTSYNTSTFDHPDIHPEDLNPQFIDKSPIYKNWREIEQVKNFQKVSEKISVRACFSSSSTTRY